MFDFKLVRSQTLRRKAVAAAIFDDSRTSLSKSLDILLTSNQAAFFRFDNAEGFA